MRGGKNTAINPQRLSQRTQPEAKIHRCVAFCVSEDIAIFPLQR